MADRELPTWSEYQEEVADFFRSMGLSDDTNVSIEGIRTSHDIDVAVTARFAGVDLLWVVECKQLKRPVSKSQVLTLRTIVDDVGADRGFMMAENGYQSGATEAVASSNITLTSLAGIGSAATDHLSAYRLEKIRRRLDQCEVRLAGLSVPRRHSATSFSSRSLSGSGETIFLHGALSIAEHGLKRAQRGQWPAAYAFMDDGNTRRVAHTMPELLAALERVLTDMEADITEREQRVSAGPDAELWRRHRR